MVFVDGHKEKMMTLIGFARQEVHKVVAQVYAYFIPGAVTSKKCKIFIYFGCLFFVQDFQWFLHADLVEKNSSMVYRRRPAQPFTVRLSWPIY